MLTLRSAMFEAIIFEGYGDVSDLRLASQDANGGGGGGSVDNGSRHESKTRSRSSSRLKSSSQRASSDQWHDEEPVQTIPNQNQSASNYRYQDEDDEEEESYIYPPIEKPDGRVTA